MHLLTPYYSFKLIDLPKDFQRLVKEYYVKQCRGCKKQLQRSAICLLCGEIVCYNLENKVKCCQNRKGMRKIEIGGFMSMHEANEGELSYHARMFEGGKAIYLIP